MSEAQAAAAASASAAAVPVADEKESSTETTSKETPPSEAAGATGEEASPKDTDSPPPLDMRAIVLTGFGGLKNVKVLKRPEPCLSEGEVRIRIKACGLNFQDLMTRQGVADSPFKTPFIMGVECAGVIEGVGEGVTRFELGDRVVALSEYGAWAELVVVHEDYAFLMPDGIDFKDATALTMNFVVAYMLLFDIGALKPGNKVLFHSAGGGIGQAIIQLSKLVKDVTLFGVCSKSKHEYLTKTVNHLIERGTDYAAQTKSISPEGVDLFLDCLGGEDCNKGYSLLKPRGHYILYGSAAVVTGETKSIFSVARAWWQVDKISPIKIFDDNKTISGLNLRQLLYIQRQPGIFREAYDKVIALWVQKKIMPIIDTEWSFEDVAEAMQRMHDRKNIGKLILDPNMEPKPKAATTPGKRSKSSADKEESRNTHGDNEPGYVWNQPTKFTPGLNGLPTSTFYIV